MNKSFQLNLTEAEDTKKIWQEYTEELYKKIFMTQINHSGVITHLEPHILECEVNWAWGSITTNKVSGDEGIPVELFQIVKDDVIVVHSDQIRSVAQSCLTLCNPMNRTTPDLPVHHQLPEYTETHVHRVSDAIQPSHPLSSPSPLAPNPSQHQSLFQWVNSSHEVAKVLQFQL